MRRRSPIVRALAGRRPPPGPDSLELIAVAFCALAIISVVATYAIHQMRMVEVTEAVSLAQGSVPDLVEYRAVYGDWPHTAASPEGSVISGLGTGLGAYTQSLTLGRDGVLTAHLNLSRLGEDSEVRMPASRHGRTNGVLTFRPVAFGAPGFEAMVLVCGHAAPPPGVRMAGQPNRTTLADDDLPPACRRPVR